MKIRELLIRNFGKFTDKKIELTDGINLIYGENESGKSTLYSFIRGMLYGMERGRGRASSGDSFTQYEPWENPNYYSGALKFESGGKTFLLDRNFDKYSKKAELICLDDGEELSVSEGDLDIILGGLEGQGYDNTVAVGQMNAKPGQALAAKLKEYASNYYVTGSNDFHLEEALSLLYDKKRDLDREVKNNMQRKQDKREKIELEASYIWRDVHRLKEEQERIAGELEYRQMREQENKQEETENKRVIDELRPNKWRIHPVEILLFIVAVILAFAFINKPWNYLVAIILFLLCGIYVWNRLKVGKKQVKTEPEIILEEITPEEEKTSTEKLRWELSHVKDELREKKIQYSNLKEQLEELDEVDELDKKQNKEGASIKLAMDRLNALSAELEKELKQRLDVKASEIMAAITGGKYTRIYIENNLDMYLMSEGRRVPVRQVSRGTIEQTYLALRMAAGKLLNEEEYPVILDDTFVYYDDIRLKNTLLWLSENCAQVLIFTCQKREADILNKMGIEFTLID